MSIARRIAARVNHTASRLAGSPEAAGAEPASKVAPAAADSPPDPLARVIAHLEYYGYHVGAPEPDKWRFVQHPSRYDFHILATPFGLRLHCGLGITLGADGSREDWLNYLNTANEQARITQFSLSRNPFGNDCIRMRAVIAGEYSRSVFAVMMDMWHDDLDLVRRKPAFPSREEVDIRATSGTIH